MSYSLYETIRKAKYENSVILTYSINLKFYESIVWMRLRRNGCYNNLLCVDGQQYINALNQEKNTLDHLGSGYVIYPVHSLVAFHPKIIMLTNKTSGKLIIASSNITVSAFTQQRELVNEFEFTKGKSEEYLYLFQDCWKYLKKVSKEAPVFVQDQLDQLYDTTPWLQEVSAPKKNVTFISYPNAEEGNNSTIFDRLYSIIGSYSIKDLTVLSPFFDKDFRIFDSIKKKYNLKKVNLIVDPSTKFDPLSKKSLQKNIKIYKFSSNGGLNKNLHAKAMYFKTDKGNYLLCGSMNFTSNAMGIKTRQNNFEAGVLYRIGKENYFDKLGLKSLIKNDNRVQVKDLTFEKKPKSDSPSEGKILISWIEYFNEELEVYFDTVSSKKIKDVSIKFYNKLDTLCGEIVDCDFAYQEKQLKILNVKTKLSEPSMFLELSICFKDGSQVKSHRAVINKIGLLREASLRTDVIGKIRRIKTMLSRDNSYHELLDLVQYCLFDSATYEQSKTKISKAKKTKDKTADNQTNDNEPITSDDVISTKDDIKKKGPNKFSGYSTDIVMDLFLRTFLKSENEVIKAPYVDIIEKEFSDEKEIGINDEDEEEVEQVEDEDEKDDSDENKKRNEKEEQRQLRSLVKKHNNHLETLAAHCGEIGINFDNEFSRHYIICMLVLKALGQKYEKIPVRDLFSFDDYTKYTHSIVSSLVSKNIGGDLTQYINKNRLKDNQGFIMGLCGIVTGLYFCCEHLDPISRERFDIDKIRENDLMWIISKLLLLSIVSRFEINQLKNILPFVHEYFIKIQNFENNLVATIKFNSIESMILEACDVVGSLGIANKVNNGHNLEKNKKGIVRGDFLVNEKRELLLVMHVNRSTLTLLSGLNFDYKTSTRDISIVAPQYFLLKQTDVASSFFNGLLEPNKSFWYMSS